MRNKIVIGVMAVLMCADILSASTVDISVATDKPTYQLGEYVTVSITAYNPNPQPVTLGFGSTLQATYLVDNTFNWVSGKIFSDVITSRTINPYDSCTWNLVHGSREMMGYSLNVGIHTVAGEVVGYGWSAPAEFEVVPEPTTLAILGIALPIFRCFTKRKI